MPQCAANQLLASTVVYTPAESQPPLACYHVTKRPVDIKPARSTESGVMAQVLQASEHASMVLLLLCHGPSPLHLLCGTSIKAHLPKKCHAYAACRNHNIRRHVRVCKALSQRPAHTAYPVQPLQGYCRPSDAWDRTPCVSTSQLVTGIASAATQESRTDNQTSPAVTKLCCTAQQPQPTPFPPLWNRKLASRRGSEPQ
jgi:hypothetical protein